MEIAIKILGIIGTILIVLKSYQYLFYFGLFFNITYKPTKKNHKYGICIAARNENKVIRNLLDSIKNQNYPLDNLKIFVVADNCTDNTAQIVKEFADEGNIETIVIEHNNTNEKTKGYALRYLFEFLKKQEKIKDCEGYFIFDADNVLAPNYIEKMNEAFDQGNEVITSFRNSKNFGQNWISFSYATHWLRTCLFEHRGKNLFNLSCRIQGTGVLFANKFVENGWKYTSLTEDRAFCSDIVVQGGRVVYCEEAKFYDEQPYKLKIALRQRIRWAKGHLQSSVENCPKLTKNIFKFNRNSFRSYDTFWLNFPAAIESICRRLLIWTLQIIVGIIAGNALGVFLGILMGILTGYLQFWIEKMISAIIVYCFYLKQIPKINFFKWCFYIFMFPFFDKIGTWSSYIALFKKVEWKAIPHDVTMDIDKIGK